MTIRFYVTDCGDGSQSPAKLLERLLGAGQLPRFAEAFYEPKGNCAEVHPALLADLSIAGHGKGWRLHKATVNIGDGRGTHYWIERKGWVLDASDGKALLQKASHYRTTMQPENERIWSHNEFIQASTSGTL